MGRNTTNEDGLMSPERPPYGPDGPSTKRQSEAISDHTRIYRSLWPIGLGYAWAIRKA